MKFVIYRRNCLCGLLYNVIGAILYAMTVNTVLVDWFLLKGVNFLVGVHCKSVMMYPSGQAYTVVYNGVYCL